MNRSAQSPHHEHLVALIPSRGHGGGIEVYVEALLECAERDGADVHRCVLTDANQALPPTLVRKVLFALRAIRIVRRLRGRTRLIAFLPNLAGVALISRRLGGGGRKAIVTFYGYEIWSAGIASRLLWRFGNFELVTISGFSAGALAQLGPAKVVPPGVPAEKYAALVALPGRDAGAGQRLSVLSVFRLPDAAPKGAFVLLEAVELLRGEGCPLELTMAGFGTPPESLGDAVRARADWARVVASPGEEELLSLYGQSDLFVLATRVAARPIPSGEGFGIVLAEAALAGLPVVAPAFGGSSDAFLQGITGIQPVDESATALATALRTLVSDPSARRRLGANGRAWAAERLNPEAYGRRVAQELFGAGGRECSRLVLAEELERSPQQAV